VVRVRAVAVGASILALASAASCQWAGDSKAVRVPFSDLKQKVDDVNTRLTSAVQSGSADQVPALDKELNAALDQVEGQSSAVNLMDREHLAIDIATARKCITDLDRYAQSGDQDLLRAQLQQLTPTIAEIDELLDRAQRTTTAQ
jgi:hypothetical protein